MGKKAVTNVPTNEQKIMEEGSAPHTEHSTKEKKRNQHRFLDEYDTVVQCQKCGRKQYLMFANGLKNGWSQCCRYTMPIIECHADIEKAVKSIPITVEKKRSQQ